MREYQGTASGIVDATPESVFDLITDIGRLPEWNAVIESVAEAPHQLANGAEWVVLVHPKGMPRWPSRSRVVAIDRHALRFSYRSQTDDGNPSYVDWTWCVTAANGGAQITVDWDGHPLTFWRRMLVVPLVRRPMLEKEVRASISVVGQQLHDPGRTVSGDG